MSYSLCPIGSGMTYSDSTPQQKAARASVEARRRRAQERRDRAERRTRQFTPGHHETCPCSDCERGRAASNASPASGASHSTEVPS